jgi:hypothetical protein
MRKTLTALAILLFFAMPKAGHASPFQYTMTLYNPSYWIGPASFNGTYTFTVPTILDYTDVSPVGFNGPKYSGYTYIEVPDLTWSANGTTSDIMFYYSPYPGTDRQFLNVQINGSFNSYGALAFSLQPALDDLYNPYHWVGLYWDPNDNLLTNATLDITDLGSNSSPVPEPSSILMLGTGILGVVARMRRKTS